MMKFFILLTSISLLAIPAFAKPPKSFQCTPEVLVKLSNVTDRSKAQQLEIVLIQRDIYQKTMTLRDIGEDLYGQSEELFAGLGMFNPATLSGKFVVLESRKAILKMFQAIQPCIAESKRISELVN